VTGPTIRRRRSEAFDWERRYVDAAYRIEKPYSDPVARALGSLGFEPHVDRSTKDAATDILWWEGVLTADQWEAVRLAHDVVRELLAP
jgi:hypothetical protein